MVFLNAKDQLRQRMAWALSQILVITPNQIETSKDEAEVYLNYYDIFVVSTAIICLCFSCHDLTHFHDRNMPSAIIEMF